MYIWFVHQFPGIEGHVARGEGLPTEMGSGADSKKDIMSKTRQNVGQIVQIGIASQIGLQ